MKKIKNIQLILTLAILGAFPAFGGTTMTCVGEHLLLVETVGDSGIPGHVGRNGVLFFKDQLVERRHGASGDTEVRWEKISVNKKKLSSVFYGKKGDSSVDVTRKQLTVKRLDGTSILPGQEEKVVIGNVLCSSTSILIPVP